MQIVKKLHSDLLEFFKKLRAVILEKANGNEKPISIDFSLQKEILHHSSVATRVMENFAEFLSWIR